MGSPNFHPEIHSENSLLLTRIKKYRMRIKNYIIALTFLTMLLGETYHVPGDFSTIQSAINESSTGDSILVGPGLYLENINFNGKGITVASYYVFNNDSSLIMATIVDAQDDGSVVTFDSGESNSSTLQGFTLQNGTGNNEDPDGNGTYYTYGGGIYILNSNPNISDCIIKNNVGNEGGGGGVFCYNSSPIFINCTFLENESDDVGGGLYARSGSSPEFYNCFFIGNLGEFGAGCYLRNDSQPIMEYVTFENNVADNSGGAMVLKDGADLEATHLYIINNEADGLGGGIYVNNADTDLSYLLVGGNSSSSGGGIYTRNDSQIMISHGTIGSNNASTVGGGIYLRDGSSVIISNSIIWGNDETQVYFRSTGDDVEIDVSYTSVQGGEDGIIDNDNGDVNWGDGNFDTEPYFCNPPLSNYYLRENSQCLNAGSDGSFMGCFDFGCGPVNLGPIWYVDLDGHNGNDGSLETPFATISHAILSASDGDTIRLNPNHYSESFNFNNKEIVLESRAFELNMMELINETAFVPLSDGSSCLTLTGPLNDNATLRGFSFRDGSTPIGGGLVLNNCSPIFENIIVENNMSEFGGGLYLNESNAVFENCTIRNNVSNMGGGIYIMNGAPIFKNVLISDNIAYWGAGMYAGYSQPNIQLCTFRNNEAFIEGGGFYLEGGLCEMGWTSFENNIGIDFGAGIVANMSSLDLNHTTFYGNVSGAGSAITFMGSTGHIQNSILWDNEGTLFYSIESSGISTLNISYSDVTGGESNLEAFSNFSMLIGSGILNGDPQFCNSPQNDFNLAETSICFNASNTGSSLGAFNSGCEGEVSIEKDIIPEKFFLSQNYPNPFNPKTTIQFSLLNSGIISLNVFNIKGEMVKTLKSGFSESGLHSIIWNGLNQVGELVPSGLYVVQLISKDRALNRKMLLLK